LGRQSVESSGAQFGTERAQATQVDGSLREAERQPDRKRLQVPGDGHSGAADPLGFQDAELAEGACHAGLAAEPLVDVEGALVLAGGFVVDLAWIVRPRPEWDMLEFCRDRQGDVLRFTTDTAVWPTNNISERGVRPLKTQQKISGRLTSDDTTQDRLDIRSYLDTACKHSKNAMDVLYDLMLGTPWQPAAPALSP
jgi:hypothetical protein